MIPWMGRSLTPHHTLILAARVLPITKIQDRLFPFDEANCKAQVADLLILVPSFRSSANLSFNRVKIRQFCPLSSTAVPLVTVFLRFAHCPFYVWSEGESSRGEEEEE